MPYFYNEAEGTWVGYNGIIRQLGNRFVAPFTDGGQYLPYRTELVPNYGGYAPPPPPYPNWNSLALREEPFGSTLFLAGSGYVGFRIKRIDDTRFVVVAADYGYVSAISARVWKWNGTTWAGGTGVSVDTVPPTPGMLGAGGTLPKGLGAAVWGNGTKVSIFYGTRPTFTSGFFGIDHLQWGNFGHHTTENFVLVLNISDDDLTISAGPTSFGTGTDIPIKDAFRLTESVVGCLHSAGAPGQVDKVSAFSGSSIVASATASGWVSGEDAVYRYGGGNEPQAQASGCEVRDGVAVFTTVTNPSGGRWPSGSGDFQLVHPGVSGEIVPGTGAKGYGFNRGGGSAVYARTVTYPGLTIGSPVLLRAAPAGTMMVPSCPSSLPSGDGVSLVYGSRARPVDNNTTSPYYTIDTSIQSKGYLQTLQVSGSVITRGPVQALNFMRDLTGAGGNGFEGTTDNVEPFDVVYLSETSGHVAAHVYHSGTYEGGGEKQWWSFGLDGPGGIPQGWVLGAISVVTGT